MKITLQSKRLRYSRTNRSDRRKKNFVWWETTRDSLLNPTCPKNLIGSHASDTWCQSTSSNVDCSDIHVKCHWMNRREHHISRHILEISLTLIHWAHETISISFVSQNDRWCEILCTHLYRMHAYVMVSALVVVNNYSQTKWLAMKSYPFYRCEFSALYRMR